MADVAVVPAWSQTRRPARRSRGRSSAAEIEALYRDLAPRILGYLRANRAPDPEDLLSEVFFHVARDFDQFTGDRSERRRWVFGIARHRLADAWRRRAVRPVLAESAVPDVMWADLRDVPIDPDLIGALGALTDEQRDVVVLRFVGDLTLRDVAEIVGRDVAAVKALQHRGLAALQRALDGRAPVPAGGS